MPNVYVEIEKALLGSVIMEPGLLWEASTLLKPEYFGLGTHSLIFTSLLSLSAQGKPTDMVSLCSELESSKSMPKIGDVSYVSSLIDGVPDRPSIAHFASLIRDAYSRRQLLLACQNVSLRLDDSTRETDAILNYLDAVMLEIRSGDSSNKAVLPKELSMEVLNELATLRQSSGEVIGMATGIPNVDRFTTGIRPEEYWVVGGAPSRGKSVLGVQVAALHASQGIPTLLFSFEMTGRQVIRRMLPAESHISARLIRDPRLATEGQISDICEAGARLAQWPLWICDPDGMDGRQIVAMSKLMIRRYGVKLVVVDYLQIIQGEEKDVRGRVTNASNYLRTIPKSERVPVIALSQLRRPDSENERPTMFHLKESGDIEAHAHTILLIYRPKDDDGMWTGEDEIIIAKQREGMVGTERVVLNENKLMFMERE